jgi:hypothetical protein
MNIGDAMVKRLIFVFVLSSSLALIAAFYPTDGNANSGMSVEGDSAFVTYVHSVAVDSAQAHFAFGTASPYLTMSLLPIAGADNVMLVSDEVMDLDSIGGHYVLIEVWDAGAVVDSMVGVWYHENYATLRDTLTDIHGDLYVLMAYLGACDDCYMQMYPKDGSPNKDSTLVFDPSLGADSAVGKVVWMHSNTAGVYDTAYFYYDPWD